jgi:hypothetical protein
LVLIEVYGKRWPVGGHIPRNELPWRWGYRLPLGDDHCGDLSSVWSKKGHAEYGCNGLFQLQPMQFRSRLRVVKNNLALRLGCFGLK